MTENAVNRVYDLLIAVIRAPYKFSLEIILTTYYAIINLFLIGCRLGYLLSRKEGGSCQN